MPKIPVFLLSAVLLGLALLAPPVVAQTQTIAYQGYLTNTDGDAAQGSAAVVFRLYDQASGGTALWAETQQDVVFTDGLFTVRLGAVESLEAVSFDRPLWLGVAIAGSAELAPRVALGAVPHALSVRGLRVVPGSSQNTPSPSMIGGHVDNQVDEGVNGAVIGGGGAISQWHVARANFTTIGGGLQNSISGEYGTIGGGLGNNVQSAAAVYGTIGGGVSNSIDGEFATIGGGLLNVANGESATISGGAENRAEDLEATVGGGRNNTASGEGTTVGGGSGNTANQAFAIVAGGRNNTANGNDATVAGGRGNIANGAFNATVGGGAENTASGISATVPGGSSNVAAGRGSFSAGERAKANHDGAFVWSDGSGGDFSSTAEDQFLIRATGGVGVGVNAPEGALHVTHPEDDIDLILGGAEEDALFGDDGMIASDPALPSSDLLLISNDALAVILDADGDGDDASSEFIVADDGFDQAFRVDLSGTTSTGHLELQDDLEAGNTPAEGGVYRDNVVYAWAHVNADGSVAASFGCTVTRLGLGRYRIDYDRALPNGMAPIVTPLSANDPVIATAAPSGNDGATVVVFDFVGGQFQNGDRPFFLQVAGRP